jgi:hypothetical protein
MKQKRLRRPPRSKLNLTIHPEIKDFAVEISNKRRRSLAQLFEDLVEAEWNRVNGIQPSYPSPTYTPLQQLYQPKPGNYQAPSSPYKTY